MWRLCGGMLRIMTLEKPNRNGVCCGCCGCCGHWWGRGGVSLMSLLLLPNTYVCIDANLRRAPLASVGIRNIRNVRNVAGHGLALATPIRNMWRSRAT